METTSSFQFEGFRIVKSYFDIDLEDKSSDLSITIEPSGKLHVEDNLFQLKLIVLISDVEEKNKIEIHSLGFFKFSNIVDNELKNYLYHNAPAILFPYIRAYISTLTTLSGIKPIILPTLNLSNLKDKLEKNIEKIK